MAKQEIELLKQEMELSGIWTWSWSDLSLGDLWSWSGNALECYRKFFECSEKFLWVVVVSSNYSIISGPDPLNLRFEFELERSSETFRDDLELVWTRA